MVRSLLEISSHEKKWWQLNFSIVAFLKVTSFPFYKDEIMDNYLYVIWYYTLFFPNDFFKVSKLMIYWYMFQTTFSSRCQFLCHNSFLMLIIGFWKCIKSGQAFLSWNWNIIWLVLSSFVIAYIITRLGGDTYIHCISKISSLIKLEKLMVYVYVAVLSSL